ncbi:MAG TPA: NifU family protein [Solirubrobacterales bacterium]|nr:NifU family protein [Solirubrobacterales bacterium]
MPTEATRTPPERNGNAGGVEDAALLVERVQELSDAVDMLEDPRARGLAQELLGAVLELYGDGLERIVAAIEEAGEAGASIRERLADDGTVASLLLIHDLYPVPIAERVEEALESVRPYMDSHGGNVELLGLEGDVARLRLQGSCEGCPASSATLELAIKSALEEAAPDLQGIQVEGLEDPHQRAALEISGTELPVVQAGPGSEGGGAAPQQGPVWHELNGELDGLAEGDLTTIEVGGTNLIVALVDGSMLAYLDSCPSCESALGDSDLSDGVLACPACERRYFLPRAGRSLDDDRLHLGPVPLLGSEGRLRVALPR